MALINKKTWRTLHLWIALIGGLFIINLSISGTLLVYAKDIQQWINPDYWLVEPQSSQLDIADLLIGVEQQTQSRVSRLYIEQDPKLSWRMSLMDDRYVSVNPYTQKILLIYKPEETFYGWLLRWHRWLLLKSSNGDYPLKDLVSVITVFFMLNLLVGVWLWVKPKNRWKNMKPVVKGKLQLVLLRWHNLLGVISTLPLLLIAITGVAFNWHAPIKSALEFLTTSSVETIAQQANLKAAMDKHKADKTSLPRVLNQKLLSAGSPQQIKRDQLTHAVMSARSAMPEAELHRIYMPKKTGDVIRFRMKQPAEPHPYSWLWIDPSTSQVVKQFYGDRANLTTRTWNFRYSLHIGKFFHPSMEVIWSILSLMPSVLTITGVILYLKRRRKRQPSNKKVMAQTLSQVTEYR